MTGQGDFTLLIVDDSPDLRESLVDSFESMGFKVLSAEDGQAALDIIKQQPVHFVLSDIRMPRMDGVSLLKTIRENYPDLPVVLLMSGYSDYDSEQARKMGALDLIPKPFSLEKVADLIQTRWKELTH